MSTIVDLQRALRERVTRPVMLSVAKWHDQAQHHDKARRGEHARLSREIRALAEQLPASYPPASVAS